METVRCGGSGRFVDDDELDVDTDDSADEYSEETTDNLCSSLISF